MEKSLVDNERLYQGIVDTQATLICRLLPDGTISFINNAGSTYFGRKPEELTGGNLMSLMPEDERDKLLRHIGSLNTDNLITMHDCHLSADNGQSRWLRLIIQAIFDRQGDLAGLQVEGQDITERKQAEEELRNNEEKYRSLIENIPDMVWTTDEKWNIVFVSPNAESLLGYTQEEMYQTSSWEAWFDRVHPDDIKRAKAAFGALVEQGKHYDIEYRFKKKDGQWIWLQDRSLGTYEREGRRYADGLFTDITKRKQVEEDLRENEGKYRSLILNIPDVVWTTDEEWRTVFVSPMSEPVLGYTQEEIYKRVHWEAWFDRVHPNDVEKAKAALKALVEQGKHYDIEYRFKKKDGQWIWLQDRSLGTYEREGRRYADGLFTDITKRKQTERQIDKFQKRLRLLTSQISLTAEQERRRLAIFLHDQISQTLAVIRLKLAAIQQPPSDGYSKQVANILELVDQAIQRTRSLTFDLSPPILYELGLEAALEWLAEQFQEQHDIIVKVEDDGKPKPLTDACRGLLFMAVRELLVNVVKHAKAKSVDISIRREGGKVRVIVHDDGIGFNSSQMEEQTNGFGLFSIRERLRHIDGNFNLKSRCGRGTYVSMVAPLESGKENPKEKTA